MRENRYYQSSGNVVLTGVVIMLIVGGLAAIVGGLVYGYAIFYIPFIYINFFLTLGYGALVGYLAGWAAKKGKIRNHGAIGGVGALLGAFAVYTAWLWWIFAASEQSALVVTPGGLLAVIREIAANGAWEIFGWMPTGFALYVVWLIEAGMIVGLSAMMATGVIGSMPFCERCDRWVDQEETSPALALAGDPGSLKSSLEQYDFGPLTSLAKAAPGSTAYTEATVSSCPSCSNERFLTVKLVAVSVNKDGKEEKKEANIVENLILRAQDHDAIKASWQAAPA